MTLVKFLLAKVIQRLLANGFLVNIDTLRTAYQVEMQEGLPEQNTTLINDALHDPAGFTEKVLGDLYKANGQALPKVRSSRLVKCGKENKDYHELKMGEIKRRKELQARQQEAQDQKLD